jgi:uncharacterized membrane protein YqjE
MSDEEAKISVLRKAWLAAKSVGIGVISLGILAIWCIWNGYYTEANTCLLIMIFVLVLRLWSWAMHLYTLVWEGSPLRVLSRAMQDLGEEVDDEEPTEGRGMYL